MSKNTLTGIAAALALTAAPMQTSAQSAMDNFLSLYGSGAARVAPAPSTAGGLGAPGSAAVIDYTSTPADLNRLLDPRAKPSTPTPGVVCTASNRRNSRDTFKFISANGALDDITIQRAEYVDGTPETLGEHVMKQLVSQNELRGLNRAIASMRAQDGTIHSIPFNVSNPQPVANFINRQYRQCSDDVGVIAIHNAHYRAPKIVTTRTVPAPASSRRVTSTSSCAEVAASGTCIRRR